MGTQLESRGMAALHERYRNYTDRARQLKQQGRSVAGYLCAYVPLEMFAAAGIVPIRIKGNVRQAPASEAEMPSIVCPLIRNCYDVTLKGAYDFIDGLVLPHSCDSVSNTYPLWWSNVNVPFRHFIVVPRSPTGASMEFLKDMLVVFKKRLETFTGRTISNVVLAQAIEKYNVNRSRVRQLYELRKTDPPLISGVEMMELLVAIMGLPVEESTDLVNDVITEVEQRPPREAIKGPRIMVIGSQIDDPAFIQLIEECGGSVVTDDICTGTRVYFPDVDVTPDPLDGLADRYLRKVNCPRTFRERTGSYEEYLNSRFAHIGKLVREYRVEGVIMYIYRCCDPFGMEVPAMRHYIKSLGVPVLYLEDDYVMSTMGRLRTKVQGFLELLAK